MQLKNKEIIKLQILYKKLWVVRYMKNYFCYYVIALAVNEKLLGIPNEYKNIDTVPQPKRGRKNKSSFGRSTTLNG